MTIEEVDRRSREATAAALAQLQLDIAANPELLRRRNRDSERLPSDEDTGNSSDENSDPDVHPPPARQGRPQLRAAIAPPSQDFGALVYQENQKLNRTIAKLSGKIERVRGEKNQTEQRYDQLRLELNNTEVELRQLQQKHAQLEALYTPLLADVRRAHRATFWYRILALILLSVGSFLFVSSGAVQVGDWMLNVARHSPLSAAAYLVACLILLIFGVRFVRKNTKQ
jgi:chromosome segregation ATPase